MTDPTGIDAGAPALLLTTSRMTNAADPTGIDAGAPAILLTTSGMTTNEIANPGQPLAADAGMTQACETTTAVTTRSSPGRVVTSRKSRKRAAKRAAQPRKTLAYTGMSGVVADAAALAVGAALWVRRLSLRHDETT
jgi:hypothetical protein